ncbi:MAG: hypothetical protein HW390_3074 [Candidatus Brocadiaceae bacterium]|nr:hypothetical protein [Candidatus Brocadiaceae bacterium]
MREKSLATANKPETEKNSNRSLATCPSLVENRQTAQITLTGYRHFGGWMNCYEKYWHQFAFIRGYPVVVFLCALCVLCGELRAFQ